VPVATVVEGTPAVAPVSVGAGVAGAGTVLDGAALLR
jgi:hypothetical protein